MVTTKYGNLVAVTHEDYLEYRSVPYAQPPVGELRFAPPKELTKREGEVINSTEYAPACIQFINYDCPPWNKDFFSNPEYIRPLNEDCLYLNIWTPLEDAEAPAGGYPVAFWIHGGAYLNGYATELEFDGAAYARRGVILVSVEYRCNYFGYLAHPWLTARSEQHISGNYGTLDQIAALKWVKENIADLGGNPDNITIFGQSAGSASVQTLITTPLARGLAARCIMLSGATYEKGLCGDITMEKLEEYGVRLMDAADIHTYEQLMAMPAEELFTRMNPEMDRISAELDRFFLMPCIDGYLLSDTFSNLTDHGEVEDIPIITGWTKDDYDVMSDSRALAGQDAPETMLKEGCILYAEHFSKVSKSPVYLYAFNRNLPGDNWGAFHSAELYYAFHTLSRSYRPFTKEDYDLSNELLDSWTGFMKNGCPDTNTKWEPYRSESPFVMIYDV